MDNRKIKNMVYRYERAFKKNPYFIDCNGYPAKLTDTFFYTRSSWAIASDIEGIACSPNGEKGASCSLFNCSPDIISKETYEEMVDFVKTHTEIEYFDKYFPQGVPSINIVEI